MRAIGRLVFSVTLLAGAGIYSGETMSQDFTSTLTNGYVCDPKNPGGEDTRLYYRQQDGLAINISPTASFPVVCPVQIPFNYAPYYITVGVKNTSAAATEKFLCALEESDFFGDPVRTIGKSVTLSAGEGNLLAWEGIVPATTSNYLSLRCILPPKGGVTFLNWL